jgi:hypothetical protein
LSFSPSGKCPAFQVPEEIASLVKDKERQDDTQIAELSRRNIAMAPIKTGADGGMHPVFVEAVKKNQIGVAPQEPSFLVTTAPGTIPPTVRPPRIPELASAPIVAASGEVSPPAMAIADTAGTPPARKTDGGSLFGSLFSSKPEAKTAEKSEGTLDRMARLVGLRKDSGSTVAKPKPKPKEAAKPTRIASHGAVRPKQADKPADAPLLRTTEAQPPAPAAAPPTPAGTAMNGAAPVVPTGNFDSRWSGFR